MASGAEKHAEEKQGKPRQAAWLVKFKPTVSNGTIYFDNAHGRILESNMKTKVQAEADIMGKQVTVNIEGSLGITLQPAEAEQQGRNRSPMCNSPLPMPCWDVRPEASGRRHRWRWLTARQNVRQLRIARMFDEAQFSWLGPFLALPRERSRGPKLKVECELSRGPCRPNIACQMKFATIAMIPRSVVPNRSMSSRRTISTSADGA